jgi:hypothetical protein
MENKSILITGGTGSLGKALTKHYSWLPKEQLAKKKCSSCFKKWQSKKENNPNWKGQKPQCKLCGKEIPYKQEIDGKTRNLQNRKYCLSCSPFEIGRASCRERVSVTV